jgi:hypothetical protein
VDKTVSGQRNLNSLPRSSLVFSNDYVGLERLPVVTGYRRYAGLLAENPIRVAYPEDKPLVSVRRQARPYGVY